MGTFIGVIIKKKFSIFVPNVFFKYFVITSAVVYITETEIIVNYLFFFKKRVSLKEIKNIKIENNILGKGNVLRVNLKSNQKITFSFYSKKNLDKLKKELLIRL